MLTTADDTGDACRSGWLGIIEEGNPLVYAEEYDVADLARVRA